MTGNSFIIGHHTGVLKQIDYPTDNSYNRSNYNSDTQELAYECIDIMAKNLYYLSCTLSSEFGAEDRPFRANYYTALMPTGYNNDVEKGSYIVNDDNWFWQTPN